MALPPSVTKVTKDGNVEFTDNVDRINYTMQELTRAALRDVGKFVCKQTRLKIKKKTGRLSKNIQYWVRSKQPEPNLQVGFKPGGFYGIFQEIGTSKTPKIGALTDSVEGNISKIREIEAQYLSAIEDENTALSLINEEEFEGDGE